METLTQKDVCILMFIPALFMVAKAWNNLTVHKWMDGKRRCSVYMYHGYYSAIKKNGICHFDNMDRP